MSHVSRTRYIFYFERSDRKCVLTGFLLTSISAFSYKLLFLLTECPQVRQKTVTCGQTRLPCMLLLCVCWCGWCDVDPAVLLLWPELAAVLLGLGVAIVVLNSSSSAQAAMQSETSPSLPPHGTLRHLNASAAATATSVPLLPLRAVGNSQSRPRSSTFDLC